MKLYLVTGWFVLFSVISLVQFGLDKHYAKSGARRIPERTLLLWAILGGSPGALAGMYLFRHKTRHRRFTLGLPAILICQIALAYLILR